MKQKQTKAAKVKNNNSFYFTADQGPVRKGMKLYWVDVLNDLKSGKVIRIFNGLIVVVVNDEDEYRETDRCYMTPNKALRIAVDTQMQEISKLLDQME